MSNSLPKPMRHPHPKRRFKLAIATLLASQSFLAIPGVIAQTLTPGIVIDNQATGSFVDTADGSTRQIESNVVSVTVGEVAGISVTATGTSGAFNPSQTVYFTFTITNEGNDPTQFFIPSAANLTGNATQASNIEITGYSINGSSLIPLSTPIVVPNGGGQTGRSSTSTAGLLTAPNPNGEFQIGGYITVRVPVRINAIANTADVVTVRLGDTPVDTASTSTPQARLQNQVFSQSTNNTDVYTVDNPDTLLVTNESAGAPINGDTLLHRQEASAISSISVIVLRDYGDAPASYGDASHRISGIPTIYLGTVPPDVESGTQLGSDLGASATGDNNNGTADEDGVVFNPSLNFPNTVHVLQSGIANTIQVTASAPGILNAWIDYNQNGNFNDPGEQIYINQALTAGLNSLVFTPPNTLKQGRTYARFRLSSQSNLGPTGDAQDGEVEDYAIDVGSPVSQSNACSVTGLVNGSFEQPNIATTPPPFALSFGDGSIPFSRAYLQQYVPNWNTTATDSLIEIWQSNHIGGDPAPTPSYAGGQHAEINATQNAALYQDVLTTPGTTLTWQFAHRGRRGADTLDLRIGRPGSTTSQGTFITNRNAWRVYTGTYVVPANQYVTRLEFLAVATSTGDTSLGNFIDGVQLAVPPCVSAAVSNANVLLVKRITAINNSTASNGGDSLSGYIQEEANPYDDNVLEPTLAPNPPIYPVADTDKWPNTTAKTSSSFLTGGINGGNTRPGDVVEYTIYFLSTGTTAATNVRFCDRIPSRQTFVPQGFNSIAAAPGGSGSDRGIALSYNGTYASHTNINDGDTAQYIERGVVPLPAVCGGNLNSNPTGAVIVNLGQGATGTSGGTIPFATSAPNTDTATYGFIRFKARVD